MKSFWELIRTSDKWVIYSDQCNLSNMYVASVGNVLTDKTICNLFWCLNLEISEKRKFPWRRWGILISKSCSYRMSVKRNKVGRGIWTSSRLESNARNCVYCIYAESVWLEKKRALAWFEVVEMGKKQRDQSRMTVYNAQTVHIFHCPVSKP